MLARDRRLMRKGNYLLEAAYHPALQQETITRMHEIVPEHDLWIPEHDTGFHDNHCPNFSLRYSIQIIFLKSSQEEDIYIKHSEHHSRL